MHLQSKTSSTGDTVAQGDSVCICILSPVLSGYRAFHQLNTPQPTFMQVSFVWWKSAERMLMPLPTQCKHSSRVAGNKANEPERNQTDKLQATWPKQDSWQISKKVLQCKQENTDLSNILSNSDITCFYCHMMSECNMKKSSEWRIEKEKWSN